MVIEKKEEIMIKTSIRSLILTNLKYVYSAKRSGLICGWTTASATAVLSMTVRLK